MRLLFVATKTKPSSYSRENTRRLKWDTIVLEVLSPSNNSGSADTGDFNGKVTENYDFLRRRFIDLRSIFQKQLVLHEPTKIR